MPPQLASAAAETPCAYSDLINRRISIRYPCAATVASIAGKRHTFKKVRIHDVSQRGIALVFRKPPQVGEWVFLQLTNRILEFTFDMAAEVRHVRPGKRGTWIVGLEFDAELSLAELAALL